MDFQSKNAQEQNTVNVGDTLDDRYLLTDLIGRGGCGLVFCATDINLQRDVAIKVLSGEGLVEHDMLKRFEQESQILRRLRSANTVYFYDCGETIYHQPYIVMEYVHGKQLKTILEEETKLAPKRVVAIIVQVLSALSEAHSFGFIHRDLKPSNIMLTERPGFPDDFVKVLDFGIAKAISDDENGAMRPDVAGTPKYMPPEQFKNEPLSPASDLYSIGCIAYEMLTGVAPFDGDSLHVIVAKHIFMTPPPMGPEFNQYPNLVSVIFKLLEKKPESRFANAHEVIEMLEHWAEPELIPQMLDYAVPVAEEEFSLEESIETIPLQLPPDFARRLANMPMSGPVAITDEPTTIGLSQQSGMSQQIGLSQTNLTPAIDTSLEEEDSMEATRFEVPSLPNQNLNTNNNRLHIVTSQLKAFILLNDLNHGQRKYLAIALSVTMILLVTVVIVIVVKAINSDDDTESPKTEAVAVAENDKTADNPDKPSDDINNSKDKADEETPKNNEDNAADAKEDKPAADDDKKDKESSPGSDDADTPNNENTESDKDTDKKSAHNNASDAQYPIFSFTLKYSPANAKVTFTHAEGKCGAGKCSLKTTSTTNPAAIVISANGYKKQRLVIKKEAPVYSAYLKKDAPKKANTGKKTNTGKKPVI